MIRFVIFAVAAAIICLPVRLVSGEIIIDGTTSSVALGNGVIADGTLGGLPVVMPNDFNNNFLVWTTGDGTATTDDADAVSLSELDIVSIAGTQYLRFALDNQENANANAQVTITDLIVNVYDVTDVTFSSPTTIWDFNNTGNNIVINQDGTTPLADLTQTPLGNGADVVFLIPRSLFNGTNFLGEDKLKLTVSGLTGGANDRGNGSEEFDLLNPNVVGATFLDPNELVEIGAIPEPGSLILFATAMSLISRRRRS